MSNFFTEFPEMPKATYRGMKKAIDAGYKDFAREWGDTIDAIFNPLLKLLVFFEDLLIATPWPIFMIVLMALTYWGSRSIKLCVSTFFCALLMAFVTHGCSIASFSFIPNFCINELTFSEAKILIRLSSRDK